MDQPVTIDSERASASLGVMQGIQPSLKLCAISDKSLVDLSDELLIYIQLVLKDESPQAPATSLEEWSRLLTFLRAHWINPLLYRIIGSLPSECRPPETITNELRQDFLVSVWVRNSILLEKTATTE